MEEEREEGGGGGALPGRLACRCGSNRTKLLINTLSRCNLVELLPAGSGGQRSGLLLSPVLKVVPARLPDQPRPLATLALPHCVEGIRCKFELLPFRCVGMDGYRDPEQLRGNWALLMTQLRQDPRVTCQHFCDLSSGSLIGDPSLLSGSFNFQEQKLEKQDPSA